MVEIELTDGQAEMLFEQAKNKVCDWEYRAANHRDDYPSPDFYEQMKLAGYLREAEKWKAIANAISEAKFGKTIYEEAV